MQILLLTLLALAAPAAAIKDAANPLAKVRQNEKGGSRKGGKKKTNAFHIHFNQTDFEIPCPPFLNAPPSHPGGRSWT